MPDNIVGPENSYEFIGIKAQGRRIWPEMKLRKQAGRSRRWWISLCSMLSIPDIRKEMGGHFIMKMMKKNCRSSWVIVLLHGRQVGGKSNKRESCSNCSEQGREPKIKTGTEEVSRTEQAWKVLITWQAWTDRSSPGRCFSINPCIFLASVIFF